MTRLPLRGDSDTQNCLRPSSQRSSCSAGRPPAVTPLRGSPPGEQPRRQCGRRRWRRQQRRWRRGQRWAEGEGSGTQSTALRTADAVGSAPAAPERRVRHKVPHAVTPQTDRTARFEQR